MSCTGFYDSTSVTVWLRIHQEIALWQVMKSSLSSIEIITNLFILLQRVSFLFIFICVCTCECMYAHTCALHSVHGEELAVSFHHVALEAWTQFVNLDAKCLYSLTRLTQGYSPAQHTLVLNVRLIYPSFCGKIYGMFFKQYSPILNIPQSHTHTHRVL